MRSYVQSRFTSSFLYYQLTKLIYISTFAFFTLTTSSIPLVAAEDNIDQRLNAIMQELNTLKAQQAKQQKLIEQQAEIITNQKKQLQANQASDTPAFAIETQAELKPTAASAKEDARLTPLQKATVANTGEAVTAGSHPGSFRLPGSNTSIKVGGFVKADAIYDLGQDSGDSFNPALLRPEGAPGSEREGSFRAHARQTRLRFESWTPTQLGEASLAIEGDFFGEGGNEGFANGTGFRLRHAYGQLGPLLIGQTYTLFMPVTAYPLTVDAFGPTGIPSVRQAQIRYTAQFGPDTRFAFSAENSEFAGHSDGTFGPDGIPPNMLIGSEYDESIKAAIDVAPDFIAAFDYEGQDAGIKLSGLLRFFDTDIAGVPNDTATGWGVHLSGYVDIWGDDRLAGGITYGQGVGRYLINGAGTDAEVNTETGKITPEEEWGYFASFQHHWAPGWMSNFVYGHEQHPDAIGGVRALDTVHANLLFSPTADITLGLEYMRGWRDDVNDAPVEADRIQFGALWNFN